MKEIISIFLISSWGRWHAIHLDTLSYYSNIALVLKYINRIICRIIQEKGVITPDCAVFASISWNVQGHFSKGVFSFSHSIGRFSDSTVFERLGLEKSRVPLYESMQWSRYADFLSLSISYLSRFFPLVYENLCNICSLVSGHGAPADLHQVPTSAVWIIHILVMFEFFNTKDWLNHTGVGH